MTPAIVITRKPELAKRPAKAIGPIVFLPADAPPHLKAHELTHVRWWWAVTIPTAAVLAAVAHIVPWVSFWAVAASPIVYAALYRTQWFRYRAELAAYVVAARIAPTEARRFSRALAREYGVSRSEDGCYSDIKARI